MRGAETDIIAPSRTCANTPRPATCAEQAAELDPNDAYFAGRRKTRGLSASSGSGVLRKKLRASRRSGTRCSTALVIWVRFALAEAFLKINQVTGFDCQSCAWPSPDKKRKIFEFCENGAKAVSDESTKKRITPEFFAKHSISGARGEIRLLAEPAGTSDFAHGTARERDPLSADHMARGLCHDRAGAEQLWIRPTRPAFYTSGKTTNEPAFLLQLFARQFGTNNLPDCSNMCHESSGVAMVETLGIGKGTATLEDMESTDLIFIFGNNPGTNHPRMLTSLQKAKDQGAKIIAVNPLPEVSLMRVTNPNPQDYPNPLELPFALLGKGQALADLYLPVRVNGDVAAIKGILKDLFERETSGTHLGD